MFQSTHPRRVRLMAMCAAAFPGVFQSTHPRRVRLTYSSLGRSIFCFNPRTHVGCDVGQLPYTNHVLCFNPRTHVGCDLQLRPLHLCADSFNPRTHVGCDLRMPRPSPAVPGFNPRTHVGCDCVACRDDYRNMWFQSTHPRRVRR